MDYVQQVASPQLQQLQAQYQQLQGLLNQRNQINQNTPATPAASQTLLLVDGIEGARAFPLAPNSRVALFDSNDDVFYYRSSDANGVEAPLKIGRYVLEDAPAPQSDLITKKDLEDFKSEVIALLSSKGGRGDQNHSKRNDGSQLREQYDKSGKQKKYQPPQAQDSHARPAPEVFTFDDVKEEKA